MVFCSVDIISLLILLILIKSTDFGALIYSKIQRNLNFDTLFLQKFLFVLETIPLLFFFIKKFLSQKSFI